MWDKDVILSLFRLNDVAELDLAQIVGSKLDISVSNSYEIKLKLLSKKKQDWQMY
jgi:hypothetical protein